MATAAGADRLVFLDVDCIPGPTTLTTYARHLHPSPSRPSPAVLGADVAYLPPREPGCGGWEHQLHRLAEVGVHRPDRVRPAPGETRAEPDLTRFWSLSFALTAADFARTGGFCPLFVGYGGEDTDFAQVVGSLGGSLTWVGARRHTTSTTPPRRRRSTMSRRWCATPASSPTGGGGGRCWGGWSSCASAASRLLTATGVGR
ncbi:hypothetical protein BJF80_16030 [Serinicoccus sp. CUA-874]|uniref:galactosyltransferase-related protein n=1 Tax=Serinicoccus sp. CUA-874 TaxID=1517939 RepID=UPI00096920F1|nr:galactosyltransferase-related protein [Serinicoccus sp. CUA-874]OLT18260.1 hypothetical protein BJF80_16030 [Serinicoccus sp. CUA-874]